MSKIFVTTLRPSLLVNIKTSIKGNVSYDKSDEKVKNRGRVEISTWETEKTVLDAIEQKAATEVRSKARNLVVGVCAVSEFGLLCSTANRPSLDRAFEEARTLCADFNKKAKVTRVKFNAIAATINPNDREAVRAINGEVRDLLAEMQAGIKELNVERVRDAANRATKLGNTLTPEAKARIDETIKAVRATAVNIVKAGEQAATVIDKAVITKLKEARTAFLDIEPAAKVRKAKDTSGRALDLAPHKGKAAATTEKAAPKAVPELDI